MWLFLTTHAETNMGMLAYSAHLSKLRGDPVAETTPNRRGDPFWHVFEVRCFSATELTPTSLIRWVSLAHAKGICGPIVDRSHPVSRLITWLFSHLLSPGRRRKDSTAGRESCCRPSEWRTESLGVIKGWQQSRRRETSAKTKALLWWNIQGEAARSTALLPYPQNATHPQSQAGIAKWLQNTVSIITFNYVHQCSIGSTNLKRNEMKGKKAKERNIQSTHCAVLKKQNGPRSV